MLPLTLSSSSSSSLFFNFPSSSSSYPHTTLPSNTPSIFSSRFQFFVKIIHSIPSPIVLFNRLTILTPLLLICQLCFTFVSVSATCDCGYVVTSGSQPSTSQYLFTELFETDFLHLKTLDPSSDWIPQDYNVSPVESRGPYGKAARPYNVKVNPVRKAGSWSAPAIDGSPDPGLQLWARHPIRDAKSLRASPEPVIEMSEISSARRDFLYGSFRVSMKLANVSGSCGSFFFYHNDSQEIDVEFLSRNFYQNESVIHLINQSPDSARLNDASETNGYLPYNLTFNPSLGFHEYRFDWLPESISFYADSSHLWSVSDYIPDSPGSLMLNHWSNGNEKWTGTLAAPEAKMTVNYVKVYFNSSDPHVQSAYEERCPKFTLSRACQVPNQYVLHDPSLRSQNSARTVFLGTNSPASSLMNQMSHWLAFTGFCLTGFILASPW